MQVGAACRNAVADSVSIRIYRARKEAGGARPRKEELRETGESRRKSGICSRARYGESRVATGLKYPASNRESSAAAESRISLLVEASDELESGNAPGNCSGLNSLKLPCPSFNRTATGRLVHAVVTITSGQSSPFTSREES